MKVYGTLLTIVLSLTALQAQMIKVEEAELYGQWNWVSIEKQGQEASTEEVFGGPVITTLNEDGTYSEEKPNSTGEGRSSSAGFWRLDMDEEEVYVSLSPDGENWRPATIRTYEPGRIRFEFVSPAGKSYIVWKKMEE